jgi:short-subunit dehydrogenase
MTADRLASEPHALVTGAAGAIGAAIAAELRRRRPGARLSLVDRDRAGADRVASEIGGAVEVFERDLGDIEALPDLVTAACAAHGPIDGLVNCAGVMEVRRFESMPWERAAELLRVDLVSPLRLMHLCVESMIATGRAPFVVNVTSMAGRVPLKGCAFYGAAKAGLSMASEVAHAELGPRGLHVVTVYPGPVASALERGARAQFGVGWLARAVPNGRPAGLARRVLDAVERGEARVVYPSIYTLGYRAADVAARVALSFGPLPLG